MDRTAATLAILTAKQARGLTWAHIATVVGASKEWVTAACLGQMTMTKAQATALGAALQLTPEVVACLQIPPYRGSLPTTVPTDPLIYRFHELVSVYGTTFKALIHEEFGDGIMSAINFKMDLGREAHPDGDRVRIVMSGKYLPYLTY